jgi:hypothetical protein
MPKVLDFDSAYKDPLRSHNFNVTGESNFSEELR